MKEFPRVAQTAKLRPAVSQLQLDCDSLAKQLTQFGGRDKRIHKEPNRKEADAVSQFDIFGRASERSFAVSQLTA